MQILELLRSKSRIVIIGVASIIVVIVGVALLSSSVKIDINLIVGSESLQLRTGAHTVGAALRDAGVELGPDDRVIPDLDISLNQGDSIEVLRARLVLIEVDGEASWVFTAQDAPLAIIADAGLSIDEGDRLWVDGVRFASEFAHSQERPSQLRLRRAVPLTLDIDGEVSAIRSAAPTLGEALWENGIELMDGDELEPSPETSLSSHLGIFLRRSRPVWIEIDGGMVGARVVAATVGEALDIAGVALVGQDYSVPGINETLPENGNIMVVRVHEQVLLEQQPIPFGSYYQPAPEIEIDNTELLSTGAYGLRATRVRVRFENGIETGRTVEGEWVVREPEPRIVGYGTKIVIRTLNTPDGPVEYWRAVEMFATSYYPCGIGGGPTVCSYFTRSGMPVAKGVVALLPEWYRYLALTQVYVPGYGLGTVGDTGCGIAGRHWIDLAYEDHDYVSWASYEIVYFLTPVPASIMWILDSASAYC
jgi:uncharacterized protein YabE (DUF348 family)